MAGSPADGDGPEGEIRPVHSREVWVATDVETGVASRGVTRADALENLDEALALLRGEIADLIDSPTANSLARASDPPVARGSSS